jgi:hypothetical protein
MGPEHGLERLVVAASSQALEPAPELSDAADEADDRHAEGQDDDDERADDQPDVGRDERVEVDWRSLQGRVDRV